MFSFISDLYFLSRLSVDQYHSKFKTLLKKAAWNLVFESILKNQVLNHDIIVPYAGLSETLFLKRWVYIVPQIFSLIHVFFIQLLCSGKERGKSSTTRSWFFAKEFQKSCCSKDRRKANPAKKEINLFFKERRKRAVKQGSCYFQRAKKEELVPSAATTAAAG